MSMPTLPAAVLHNILTFDIDLCDLTLKVSNTSKIARFEWVKTRRTIVEDFTGAQEKYLVNGLGRVTNMPCFDVYNDTWKSNLTKNPLNVEWLNYDANDQRSNQYISTALQAMIEQVDIWGADEDTRVCAAYIYYNEFIEMLKLLYKHVTDMIELKATCVQSQNRMTTVKN